MFKFRVNQAKYVVLLNSQPLSNAEFATRLSAQVNRSATKAALVFVHGYNVSFNDAIERTAILAYDLKFDGAVVTFSWPSRASPTDYVADEENAEYSIPDLEKFLLLVANVSGAKTIHVVAHSMGNRPVLRALANLRASGSVPRNIGQAVLAAPDVDRDIFQQLIRSIQGVAARITLYSSSRDRALKASREWHDNPRAGEGGSRIFVASGIESVDASAVDTGLLGHSYYANNRSVVSDLFYVIRNQLPQDRPCLSARLRASIGYWVFDRCR